MAGKIYGTNLLLRFHHLFVSNYSLGSCRGHQRIISDRNLLELLFPVIMAILLNYLHHKNSRVTLIFISYTRSFEFFLDLKRCSSRKSYWCTQVKSFSSSTYIKPIDRNFVFRIVLVPQFASFGVTTFMFEDFRCVQQKVEFESQPGI